MVEEDKKVIQDYKNNLNNIPKELKDCPNWVCYIKIMDESKGKYSKIPISPKTLRGAKSNDPATWDSYENARMRLGKPATVKTKVNGQDTIITALVCGIGFMFSNSPYFGIDLDGCDNEAGQALKKEFTQTLESYAEDSPSGKGIHIICRGTLPKGARRKDNIEMYEEGRFFTMTGKIYQNYTQISDCTDKIKQLYDKYLNGEKGQNTTQKAVLPKPIKSEATETEELLEDLDVVKLAENSKKGLIFKALHAGNWQGLYKSQSEADAALCGILAFFTGRDYNQIDRIFRSSGLMRDKWDEMRGNNTYGEMTINTAISNCINAYDPNYKSKSYKVTFDDEEETHSPSSSTPQPGQNPGEELPPDGYLNIGIKNNSYYRMKIDEKTGELKFNKKLSNFIGRILEFIKFEEEYGFAKIQIRTDKNKEYIKTVSTTCFEDIKSFRKVLKKSNLDLVFRATRIEELEDIGQHMCYFEYPERTGVRSIGLHKFNNKWCFVGNDKTIDADGAKKEDIVFLKAQFEVIKTNILNYDEITKEELELLKPHLFNFTEHSKACIILGYIASCWFRMIFKEASLYQPHLQIIGAAGSGKTTTRNNIITPFFAMTSNAIDANQITHFGGIKAASSSNTVPMLVEEYKPYKMSETRKQIFSDLGRNCYDCTDAIRGRADQTIEIYPQTTPIILIGEAGTSETALEERSIILNFNKLDITPDHTKSMKFLEDNKELVSKLGRTILNLALKTDKDTLKNLSREYEVIFKEKISADRIRNSACIVSIGYKAITSIFEKYGIDVPISLKEMIRNTSNYIFEDMLDSLKSPKTAVEKTLEAIDAMMSTLPLATTKSLYRVKDNELILDVKLLYPFLTKYIKDYNVKDVEVLSQDDFTKQIRKTQYFLEYKNVKMPELQEIKLKARKCYILNIPQITARLELQHILNEFIAPEEFNK